MRLLSKKQVREKVSLSYASIDRYEQAGKFPKRVRFGFRVFWPEDEIDGWILRLLADRDLGLSP